MKESVSRNESGLPWRSRKAPIDTGDPPCRIDWQGNWNCGHEHVGSPLGVYEGDIYELPEMAGWTVQSNARPE